MVSLSPSLYIIHSDQPIYTMRICQEMNEHLGMNVHVCLCVCGKMEAGGELGKPISHTEEQRQAGRYAPSPE